MAGARKNIVMIVVDDLNTWLGAYGGRIQAKTPNIDGFARSAAFFRRAYCSTPYCNASRIGFLTGRSAHRTGVYVNEPLDGGRFRTLPETLRAVGYHTFSAGKVFHGTFDYEHEMHAQTGVAPWRNFSNRSEYWDECHDFEGEPLPAGRPFNSVFGQTPREEWPHVYRHFDWSEYDNEDTPDRRATSHVKVFLQRDHSKPFLCCLGLYRPHLPWFAPRKYFDLYPLDGIPLPIVKRDDLDDVPPLGVAMAKHPFDHEAIVAANLWKSAVQAYLACVSYCDGLIGETLAALEASRYRDDTIVVLLSDNGFHHGQKLHWSKFALWEEATRVPLMIHVPGRRDFQGATETPVSLLDVFPTLLALTGVQHGGALDGSSLMSAFSPYIKRAPALTTWGPGNHSLRAERLRFTRYSDGSEELYDHLTDPFEWHNLAPATNRNADVQRMREALDSRL